MPLFFVLTKGYVEDKRKEMKLNFKERLNIQLSLGVLLALMGVALIWTGLFIAPVGEIHPSVLTAVGEAFTFSGALIGVDYSYKFKKYKIDYDDGESRQIYTDSQAT